MLVAIEGIDGAGKCTQTELLVARASANGLRATALSFPRYTETFFGQQIREYLKGNFGKGNDPRLVGLLFAGDRLQSLPAVLDALSTHDLVVADRYVASNLAYQAAREERPIRGAVIDWLAEVEYEVYGLPRADLNVLLDVPVSFAAKRLSARAERGGRVANDWLETDLDFLAKCRETYKVIARRPRWATVPVSQAGRLLSVDEISDRIWEAIKEILVTGEITPSTVSRCLSAPTRTRSSRSS
jgi:dTMP kinase